ncbi:MAG: hypothetical protein U0U67_13320 [Chitinophagales bacterium]
MTMQIKDMLFYNAEILSLSEELLGSYFAEFPEKKCFEKVFFSALWRGYIASFELIDNELFVKDIRAPKGISDEGIYYESYLNVIFPESKKMDWYSGLIRIDEYRFNVDDEDKNAVFEFLVIEHGNLVDQLKFTFDQFDEFKKEQFIKFKQTDEYKRVFNKWKLREPKMKDEKIEYWISFLIIRYLREILH